MAKEVINKIYNTGDLFLKNDMKRIIKNIGIFLFLIVFVLLVGILTGSEGEWVCEDGEWIKLGNPRNQPPAYGCSKEKEVVKNEPVKESFEAGTPLGSVRFDLGSGLMPASYKEATESTKTSQLLWTND